MTTEEQLANLRKWWRQAHAVATQRPGDALADLFGEDHWITWHSRCDHPADYYPDTEPEGVPLPDCAGCHHAILAARESMSRIERIAGRLAKQLEVTT